MGFQPQPTPELRDLYRFLAPSPFAVTMFGISFQRRHCVRIAVPLFVLLVFWQRIAVGVSFVYTYFAFIFFPTAILGRGDGWDLANFVPPPDAPEIVPRIIHQVRLGDLRMRDSWREANESCGALHPSPEWRFELWDTPRATSFVEENFPELLDTYLGYEQEIQRSNVIRYLVLYKMGGIYLDLDVKCRVPLDFFTTVDWVSPPGSPTGVNNAFMAAAPGHPFLKHTIDNLKRYDLKWISPYATDMFSTGCQFLSTMHVTYPGRNRVRVLPHEYRLSGYVITPIMIYLGASSWHRGDAAAIKRLGIAVQWLFVPWKIIVATVVITLGGAWLYYRRARMAEKIRVEDVEVLGIEQTNEDRRYFLLRLLPIPPFALEPYQEVALRPVSPESDVSSSDSTLHDDEEEQHSQKSF